jgi:formylglycine-generating enzyme required for sulfatase activity
VWWDTNLLPGETFDRVICAALEAAKVVIVAWSKVSVDRDWVLNEADEGRRRNILVPVIIDRVDVPLGLRRLQCANLTEWNGEPDHPELLSLFTRIEAMAGTPAAATAPAVAQQRRARMSSRNILYAVVALVAVLLVGVASFIKWPPAPADGDIPELVRIPAGEFTMGSEEGEPLHNSVEEPKHKVTIGKPFLMGRYEVTVAQYAKFVSEQGEEARSADCEYLDYRSIQYRPQADTSWKNPPIFIQQNNHPVVCVSWFDARSYVLWLSRKTGERYRLPSEAEWEYAARANVPTTWFWGTKVENNNDACGFANVADDSSKSRTEATWTFHKCDDGFPFTAPRGSFQPNGFGLRDMIGNVWEWVEDCYVEGYGDAPADGSPRVSDSCPQHGLRGAAWVSSPTDTRLSARGKSDPKRRYYSVGFRVVRDE